MCLRAINKTIRPMGRTSAGNSESGNVFMAIFGAIALVGLLGASIMTFMKGPLSTSVRLTKMNTAENQMQIGSQVAVMATASQTNNGDCETTPDGFVEPIPWRAATTEPHPTGGGLVPLNLGISKKDPWGTEYGYCVWNHGPVTAGAGCDTNMLQGTNARLYPVVAIISAGPDKAFTTTCRDFVVSDANHNSLIDDGELPMVSKDLETDDDIITSYTYQEATGASGGLWSLKSTDAGTAVINKKIEASGVADLKGGVLLPDKALLNCSDIKNAGVMAKSALGIEICDGAGTWTSIGGASGALATTATCAAPADAGHVRYNSTSGQPEFCNGTTWLPFSINTPGVNLVISPNNSSTMNVDGATNADTVLCTNASGFTCGTGQTFTVTNQGTVASATTVVQLIQTVNGTTTTYSAATLASVANTSSFSIKANTCTTSLAVNATCTFMLVPKATGNISYTATLRINTNNVPIATLSGSSTNFGCIVGRVAPGGNYIGCGLSNPDGSFDLVMNPSGCNGATTNPTCPGTADVGGIQKSYGAYGKNLPSVGVYAGVYWGAQQHQNMMYYSSQSGVTLPAAKYCDDLTYQGQSDWFLPSYAEWQYINSAYQAGKITMRADWYVMSDQSPYIGDYSRIVMYNGGSYNYDGWDRNNSSPFVRCVRREGLPMPAVSNDVDPDAVSIIPAIIFSPSIPATSNTVTVAGILQSITVSITGGANMNIIKNGISTGLSSVSGVKAGETLAFSMDGPAVIGTKATATITMGPDNYPWWIGYADSTRTIKGFVISGTRQPNLGGLSGADAICSAYAATSNKGLSASWKAMLSDSTTPVASRIPWNWGTLQTVTGATIVDGGLSDLFDGTFDDFFNLNENGVVSTNIIWTGSDQYGASYNPRGTTSSFFSYDWTSANCCDNNNSASYGQAGSKSATAMYYSVANSDNSAAIRCIENIDGAVDTIPASINLSNTIQAPLSSRQVTPSVAIGGMSPGATTTLSVTATGGNPKMTINGGAEVSSGIVQNGDAIIFLMDSPATVGASNKMTITGTSGVATILGYWRIWPGWDGIGTGVKRVFVTSTDTYGNVGGVSGLDSVCQGRGTAAALGGTWKAIASGIVEPEYAVNRVGYNWNELRLVDGTTVAYSGGLWTTLLSPIVKTEFGVTRASVPVYSNNADNGNAYSSVSDVNNNYNWSSGLCTNTIESNSSATKVSMVQVVGGCSLAAALFCIEQ